MKKVRNIFIVLTLLFFITTCVFVGLHATRVSNSIKNLDVYTMVTTDVTNCESLTDALYSLNLTGYFWTEAELENWALEHQRPFTEDLSAWFDEAEEIKELANADGYRVGILLYPTEDVDTWVVFNYAFVREQLNSFKLYYWHCELVDELGLWEYGK